MEDDLKKLGFTDNEIKTYLSLLHIGETPVGAIINDLKIHRQIAYNALDALEKESMVKKTKRNNIHYYKVTDPKTIIENIRKQEIIAERLSSDIQKELKKTKHEEEVNVYSGKTQIRNYMVRMYENMPEDSELCALFTAGKKYMDILGEQLLQKTESIRRKKHIKNKHLVSKTQYAEMKQIAEELTPNLREVKYIPFAIENPVSTLIWHDRVVFQILFSEEPFFIEIKNKKFREAQIQYFEEFWKIAKK